MSLRHLLAIVFATLLFATSVAPEVAHAGEPTATVQKKGKKAKKPAPGDTAAACCADAGCDASSGADCACPSCPAKGDASACKGKCDGADAGCKGKCDGADAGCKGKCDAADAGPCCQGGDCACSGGDCACASGDCPCADAGCCQAEAEACACGADCACGDCTCGQG